MAACPAAARWLWSGRGARAGGRARRCKPTRRRRRCRRTRRGSATAPRRRGARRHRSEHQTSGGENYDKLFPKSHARLEHSPPRADYAFDRGTSHNAFPIRWTRLAGPSDRKPHYRTTAPVSLTRLRPVATIPAAGRNAYGRCDLDRFHHGGRGHEAPRVARRQGTARPRSASRDRHAGPAALLRRPGRAVRRAGAAPSGLQPLAAAGVDAQRARHRRGLSRAAEPS